MTVRPPVAFFSAIVLATVAIAGTRVYDAGQKPAHHGHEYPGDAHARQVLGLAPDAELDASARTKAENIDQARAAGIPDRFVKEYRSALGAGIKLHYNPEHNRLETDPQPQTSSLADAQAALDRMQSRANEDLPASPSNQAKIKDVAWQFVQAWTVRDIGHALPYLTRAAQINFTNTGVFSQESFVMGGALTLNGDRSLPGHITRTDASQVFYTFVVQRKGVSPPYYDFLECTLTLIKDGGEWKIDGSSNHLLRSQ